VSRAEGIGNTTGADFVEISEVLGFRPISSPVCDWTLRREEGGYGLALLFCSSFSFSRFGENDYGKEKDPIWVPLLAAAAEGA
jgi:hypothetical protein